MSDYLDRLQKSSAYHGVNAPYVEDLYESYLKDPASVPEKWREHFDNLPQVNGFGPEHIEESHRDIQAQFAKKAQGAPRRREPQPRLDARGYCVGATTR